MNVKINSLFALIFIISATVSAHDNHSHGNSDEWQIKAYTSAAPAFIGDHATVISAAGKVLREGTNG